MDTNDRGPSGFTCGGPNSIYQIGCSGRLVLDRIGDRWTVLIVGILNDGTKRFSQLRNAIGDITPKVLTQTLRALERDGLITRHIYAEVPPRVEYSLTTLGRDLNGPIEAIRNWAQANGDRIAANRARNDARSELEEQGA